MNTSKDEMNEWKDEWKDECLPGGKRLIMWRAECCVQIHLI